MARLSSVHTWPGLTSPPPALKSPGFVLFRHILSSPFTCSPRKALCTTHLQPCDCGNLYHWPSPLPAGKVRPSNTARQTSPPIPWRCTDWGVLSLSVPITLHPTPYPLPAAAPGRSSAQAALRQLVTLAANLRPLSGIGNAAIDPRRRVAIDTSHEALLQPLNSPRGEDRCSSGIRPGSGDRSGPNARPTINPPSSILLDPLSLSVSLFARSILADCFALWSHLDSFSTACTPASNCFTY